jgi:hypothetical protein
MLTQEVDTKSSTAEGSVTISVDVPKGGTAFMVTGVGPSEGDYYVTLEQITSPAGKVVFDWQDWAGSTETLTDAIYAQSGPVGVVQWPIRGVDGPLTSGTWKVKLDTLENYDNLRYASGVDVTATTLVKRDPDFSAGNLSARIVWARGVDKNPGLQDAMAAAVLRWQEIWGGAGLTVDVTYATSDIDPSLDFGSNGSEGVLNAALDGSGHDLQIIVGDYIEGDPTLFGLAAGIPGSVVPSEHTFVLLSWLVHAGQNGVFNDEEIRIMGETLAHEPGHFMGLAHPVEQSYAAWDSLDDTEQCKSERPCEDDLGQNVMFPYPVCPSFTSCEPQGELTSEQATLMNQYIATL